MLLKPSPQFLNWIVRVISVYAFFCEDCDESGGEKPFCNKVVDGIFAGQWFQLNG